MLSSCTLILAALVASAPAELSPAPTPPPPEPSALVISVRGEVTRLSGARGERSVIEPLDMVTTGQGLRLGKNARVDVVFKERWITFVGGGELKLNKDRWGHPSGVRRTRNQELPSSLIPGAPGGWSALEEEKKSGSIAVDSPRETAIRDRRPTLRWRGSGGEKTVRLDLLKVVNGRMESVETWRGVLGRELRVHHALEPETLYQWRIATERAGVEEFDQAWFIVRETERLDQLDQWVRSLGELRSEGAEDRHVAETLLAVALERQLLLAEAKSSWQALASQGRILDLAAKRVASLERRALTEPRSRILLPLPFQMRLSSETTEERGKP